MYPVHKQREKEKETEIKRQNVNIVAKKSALLELKGMKKDANKNFLFVKFKDVENVTNNKKISINI